MQNFIAIPFLLYSMCSVINDLPIRVFPIINVQNIPTAPILLEPIDSYTVILGKTTNNDLTAVEHLQENHKNQLQLTSKTKIRKLKKLIIIQQNEIKRIERNIYLQILTVLFLAFLLGVYIFQQLRARKNRKLYDKEHEETMQKSLFFENVSHEFRTPLTLILGPLQILKSNIVDPKLSNQLVIMERNGERLLALINKLLDFSKIESGEQQALDLDKHDIVTVVKGITMCFQTKANEKQIHLEVESNRDSLYTYFDLEKFETILINLISNAVKFTPEKGSIKVSLEIIKDALQKDLCKIVIQDSGKGVPESDIKKIFTRFYQSKNPSFDTFQGSGIGLALTRELVKLHKGSIEVVSKGRKGSIFTVLLPVGKAHFNIIESAPKSSEVKPENLDLSKTTCFQKINTPKANDPNPPILLLIEDNTDVMDYLKEIFEGSYRILEAANGAKGIKMALKHIPDLIISDIMMPKKNGYEVCETLKLDEKTSHIPIILLTAKSSHNDKMLGLLTKADAYLIKPFMPKELMVRVKNLIGSRKKLKAKYKKEGILKPNEITVNSIDEKFLNRLIELVELHISNENFNVVLLSKKVGMSRSQLHRKLNGLLGHGPNHFIRNYRLQRAHDLLKQNAATPSEIAYQVGFSSPSYFTKCFHKYYGYPPSNIENQIIKD